MREPQERSETQDSVWGDRGDGRGAHLRLIRGGKPRPVPAAFAYPRSASLAYDTTSDARTRESVCDALRRDEALNASAIDVYVANGEVTLIGSVAGLRDERIAVEIAERCEGVREAVSQLRLSEERWEDEGGPTVA